MGVGQMVISSQPRGDRGATMEEGEAQMTTDVLSDFSQLFYFLEEIALSGKSK